MKLYIDGALVDSATGSTHDRISTNVRYGVLLSGVNAYYNGYMDDIRTYDVALDASQVASMADGNAISDPTSVTFSPLDDATNVDPTSNLSITFGTSSAATSTGAVDLYKTADDSLVESIPLTSSEISRRPNESSTSFTINPNTALQENTGYYLSIASTSFEFGTDNFWGGTTASTTWNFTTGDFTAPTISSIATSTATTTAAITWTTNEAASSKVIYSSDTAFASSTSESDTGTRVTSHSKTLSGLVACTLYNFEVVSADAALNSATSPSSSFTTSGCPGGSTPSSATSTSVDVSAAATSTITDSGRTLTVSTPANVTSTSSSIVIQIKGLPSDAVLDSIGKPASLSSAAHIVFDVTALIDNSTTLDSFDEPVTISYTYTDADVSGLDESSLEMYHYHNGSWLPLDDCSVDTGANIITCNTPSFSTFAIFGTATSNSSSNSNSGTGGNGAPWCSGPLAPGWNPSLPNGGCELSINTMPPLPPLSPPEPPAACPYYHFTRMLKFGDKGEDVRALQKFLNCVGFSLGADGPGSRGNETPNFADRTLKAVNAFQQEYAYAILTPIDTTKPTGIFAHYSEAKAYTLMQSQ
jgi:hypothetical protein